MAKGFFSREETTISRGDEALKKRPTVSTKERSCRSCGLYSKCNTPKFPVFGTGTNGVMIVLDYPGTEEDALGKVLAGESGKLFKSLLKEHGHTLSDFWVTYGVQCHPEGSPGIDAIESCRIRLHSRIEKYKPNALLVLGGAAMTSLMGHAKHGRLAGIMESDWQGCQIPDQALKTWIIPTWGLKELIQQKNDETMGRQMMAAVDAAVERAKTLVAEWDWKSQITVLQDHAEVIKFLRVLSVSQTTIAFDYETTGLKPHRKGHRIVAVSFADAQRAWAMPFFDDPEFKDLLKKVLTSPFINKIAHNGKFEAMWTLEFLKCLPAPFIWDTMLAAHSLANRKKTNLKFLTYANFGVAGYDSEIDRYLQTPSPEEELHGANGFNLIDQADLQTLLFYNAADSLFTYRLYDVQKKQAPELILQGIKFFTDASLHLAVAESNGIIIQTENAKKQEVALAAEMKKIEKEIQAHPSMKKWNRPVAFRPSAPEDLSHFVFNILKKIPAKYTATGKPKADKIEMENHDHPVVTMTLRWRKFQKIKDTYLAQFMRENTNGIIHPMFNLGRVDTFRSSSDSPNFQNVPKRDPEASRPIRLLLKPHPGQMLCEYDYKAVEVAVAACYNKDPQLIRYITDPSTDMHRDMGMQLLLKSKEQLTKDERSIAKNKFVFPEFYGSYYAKVAPDMWNALPADSIAHLQSQGIQTVEDFTAHVQDIEDDFWSNRFGVYAEWKERQWKTYLKKGYIESYTGFRCYGPMRKNEVINYPIQGSAFHVQLRTFGKMTEVVKHRGMESKMMGQIHDSIVPSVLPAEEKAFDKLIWYYGTQEIREAWDWIIVPLSLEKSKSAVDGNWADMQDCGLLQENGKNQK